MKPLQLLGFSWPGFENKSGPKPTKSGPKYKFVLTSSTKMTSSPNKSGPHPKTSQTKWAKIE